MNGVERCPMNASDFKKAARTRNCTGNDRYLCAPDRNLSSLIEFCTDTKRSLFEKGNFFISFEIIFVTINFYRSINKMNKRIAYSLPDV